MLCSGGPPVRGLDGREPNKRGVKAMTRMNSKRVLAAVVGGLFALAATSALALPSQANPPDQVPSATGCQFGAVGLTVAAVLVAGPGPVGCPTA